MRIAVLADTHDRLPEHVRAAVAGGDEIWHLGDVCSLTILRSLEELGRPVRVVRGNCDANLNWPIFLDLHVESFRVRLIHIAPPSAPDGIQLLLHGHTHVPRNELVGATRFLNPGCITRPNRGAQASYAWLELTPGDPPRWELQPV